MPGSGYRARPELSWGDFMEQKVARYKKRVILRCERDAWVRSHGGHGAGYGAHYARFSNVLANLGSKRKQMIDRLMDRMLTVYVETEDKNECS